MSENNRLYFNILFVVIAVLLVGGSFYGINWWVTKESNLPDNGLFYGELNCKNTENNHDEYISCIDKYIRSVENDIEMMLEHKTDALEIREEGTKRIREKQEQEIHAFCAENFQSPDANLCVDKLRYILGVRTQ